MTQKKYDLNSARDIFNEHGLILKENEFIDYTINMKCEDCDGYLYSISLQNVLVNSNHRKFATSNPFTISNIQHYLDLESDGTKIISTEYTNCRDKLEFLCSCGARFQMTLGQMTNRHKLYCNHCSKSRGKIGKIDYITPTRNKCNELGYILLTDNILRSTDYFEYICIKHSNKGIQRSTYDRMVRGNHGCKYCGIERCSEIKRIPEEQLKSLAESKGFIYVGCDYVKNRGATYSHVRVHVICKKHEDKGVQYMSYHGLLRNTAGCKYCIGRGRTKESVQEDIDELGLEIEVVEFNGSDDITLQCKQCGHIWKTRYATITRKKRCPNCSKSGYEIQIEEILKANSIEFIPQYKFDDCKDVFPLPFDFYLVGRSKAFEIDGQGHFYPVRYGGRSQEDAEIEFEITKKHDEMKTKYCIENNIELIRIPYYVFDDKNIDMNEYVLNCV